MDDYLALSLMIMGIGIGALLIIWGAMSLYFFLRKRKQQRAAEERIKASEAAVKAELEATKKNDKTEQ